MGLGFSGIPERTGYLRQAGLQQAAKFLGLTYNATESYEYFDIEFECADGKMFRERTFGANLEKAFPALSGRMGSKLVLRQSRRPLTEHRRRSPRSCLSWRHVLRHALH
jgi:hypothetical protein